MVNPTHSAKPEPTSMRSVLRSPLEQLCHPRVAGWLAGAAAAISQSGLTPAWGAEPGTPESTTRFIAPRTTERTNRSELDQTDELAALRVELATEEAASIALSRGLGSLRASAVMVRSRISDAESESVAQNRQIAANVARAVRIEFDERVDGEYAELVSLVGPAAAQFEYGRAILITVLSSVEASDLSKDGELLIAGRDVLIERLRAETPAGPHAELFVAAGQKSMEGLCERIPYRDPRSAALRIGCEILEKVGEEIVEKMVDKGLQKTKEKYQEVFKDLDIVDALNCVKQAAEKSTDAWLQNNVNVCTLAPEVFTSPGGVPSGLLERLCPQVMTSFEMEINRCVERIVREREAQEARDREHNNSSGPSRDNDRGPREHHRSEPSSPKETVPKDTGPKERSPSGPRDPSGPPGRGPAEPGDYRPGC
jgi:hypothetical protein